MRLSRDRSPLSSKLTVAQAKRAIIERRKEIRGHRDARMDDRCWADDYLIWTFVEGLPLYLCQFPPFSDAMKKCVEFYNFRRSDTPDTATPEANFDKATWDNDLETMNASELINELVKIQEAICVHYEIGNRPRTTEDDRKLYSVLPEKIPADFRLPPEEDFLGENKAPNAGCPSFWKSHGRCETMCHNLHQWGPCKDKPQH